MGRGYDGGKELNAFIQLQWNITCRADSVSSLSLPSIKAFNDALQVMIYTSKTNQEGEDVEARHIYFNPLSDCNGIDMRYTDVGLHLWSRTPRRSLVVVQLLLYDILI